MIVSFTFAGFLFVHGHGAVCLCYYCTSRLMIFRSGADVMCFQRTIARRTALRGSLVVAGGSERAAGSVLGFLCMLTCLTISLNIYILNYRIALWEL